MLRARLALVRLGLCLSYEITPNRCDLGSFGGGTSAFGAPKPSGFGAFGSGAGGTSAFGGGSGGGAFGQNTGSASAFGQPSGGTSAFGSGGTGLFGQKPAAPTATFGSTSTGTFIHQIVSIAPLADAMRCDDLD